jgi:hypothetical protein
MVNGVRGLCNGLGPALFGFIFYLLKVDLGHQSPLTLTKPNSNLTTIISTSKPMYSSMLSRDIPGPPFLFGAFLATIALMFALLLPNSKLNSDGFGNDVRTNEQNARLIDFKEEEGDSIQSD